MNFGAQLVTKDGAKDTASVIDGVELVAIYFSAHWCPPCRGFTPKLAEFYKKINANGKRLEIVFVSHDRDQNSFQDYYNEMPWTSVPFDDNETKEKLIQTHQVSGIPKLVFLNKDGSVKIEDGRSKVMDSGAVESFPWN